MENHGKKTREQVKWSLHVTAKFYYLDEQIKKVHVFVFLKYIL